MLILSFMKKKPNRKLLQKSCSSKILKNPESTGTPPVLFLLSTIIGKSCCSSRLLAVRVNNQPVEWWLRAAYSDLGKVSWPPLAFIHQD
tara:strand:+ start:355 stop:621 length:267 start_codon:yes stop_codon:yes gene_type:complete